MKKILRVIGSFFAGMWLTIAIFQNSPFNIPCDVTIFGWIFGILCVICTLWDIAKDRKIVQTIVGSTLVIILITVSVIQVKYTKKFEQGLRHFHGSAASFDKELAIKYFQEAASHGQVDALNELGRCYMNGDGIEKNQAEAVKCLRYAANKNHPEATYNLAVCYTHGYGVEINKQKADKLVQKAADLGCESAQKYLAQ